MSERLTKLIESARSHVMTDAERAEQRISWAWGNLAIENPRITKADVERYAVELTSPRPTRPGLRSERGGGGGVSERKRAGIALACRFFMAGTTGMLLVIYLDRRWNGHVAEAAAVWRDLGIVLEIWGGCELLDLALIGLKVRLRQIWEGEA